MIQNWQNWQILAKVAERTWYFHIKIKICQRKIFACYSIDSIHCISIILWYFHGSSTHCTSFMFSSTHPGYFATGRKLVSLVTFSRFFSCKRCVDISNQILFFLLQRGTTLSPLSLVIPIIFTKYVQRKKERRKKKNPQIFCWSMKVWCIYPSDFF